MKKHLSLLLASAIMLAASASAEMRDQDKNNNDHFDRDHNNRPAPLYDEPYRPQYHFSPPTHWMNDPNGLVYYQGYYHLYYQYNPLSLNWGPPSWGHAKSRDLIHWINLPIAIPEATSGPLAGSIFTGSAVVDSSNTSGFFTKNPDQALVAIYTLDQPTREVQNIAYSLDSGNTYINYSGNPVLNSPTGDNPNFRDPQVFWYAPKSQWIMSVALPLAHQVLFYSSPDLKNWSFLSSFGPSGIDGLQWECPNLFTVPVEGTNQQKWVLMVGVNPGAPGGGSLNQYFVGNFDGTTFTADDTVARVMDFGKDFYAAQTYNNDPQGRAIVVGWMSNWYSQLVPTYPWRGVDSLPRILSVLPNQTPTGGLLVQTPISLDSLHDRTLYNGSATLSTNPLVIPTRGASFEFETRVSSTPVPNEFQQRLEIDLLNEAGEKVTVGYDWSLGHVFVDRGGARNFENPLFADKFSAWEQNPDNSIELHVFVDRSTIEVFVDHGTQVCSLCFYMRYGPPTKMRWHALNGTVNVQNLQAYTLKSIWRR